jgi:ribosome-binding factor A
MSKNRSDQDLLALQENKEAEMNEIETVEIQDQTKPTTKQMISAVTISKDGKQSASYCGPAPDEPNKFSSAKTCTTQRYWQK